MFGGGIISEEVNACIKGGSFQKMNESVISYENACGKSKDFHDRPISSFFISSSSRVEQSF